MTTLVIDIPPETYQRLEEQSRQAGKPPETYSRELIETALLVQEKSHSQTTRDVLQALGGVRPLSAELRRKIRPGITLAEVRTILSQASGPSLTRHSRNQ